MSLDLIGIGYLGVGAVIALVLALVLRKQSASDTLLLVALWPLWAPMMLAQRHGQGQSCGERELLSALARAQSSPLSQVLPDAETARVLAARLRERTLGQLRSLRVRYRSELDEVHELIAQLVTQAELVRLQPSIAQSSGELVRELVSRVEGLEDLFTYQSSIEDNELELTADLAR